MLATTSSSSRHPQHRLPFHIQVYSPAPLSRYNSTSCFLPSIMIRLSVLYTKVFVFAFSRARLSPTYHAPVYSYEKVNIPFLYRSVICRVPFEIKVFVLQYARQSRLANSPATHALFSSFLCILSSPIGRTHPLSEGPTIHPNIYSSTRNRGCLVQVRVILPLRCGRKSRLSVGRFINHLSSL